MKIDLDMDYALMQDMHCRRLKAIWVMSPASTQMSALYGHGHLPCWGC